MVTITLEPKEFELVVEYLQIGEIALKETIDIEKSMLEIGSFAINMVKNTGFGSSETKEMASKLEEMRPEYQKQIQEHQDDLEALAVLLNRIAPERELKVD